MKKRSSSNSLSKLDNFCQIYAGLHGEASAGTLAFSSKLDLGYSLGDNVGLILHRIEYYIDQTARALLLDDSDAGQGGLVTGNTLTTILPNNPGVVDTWMLQRKKYGAAATGWDENTPQLIRDYTNLPGGGLLIPPNPLYMAAKGISLAAAFYFYYRIYYTTVSLNDAGFREMWQTWNALRI